MPTSEAHCLSRTESCRCDLRAHAFTQNEPQINLKITCECYLQQRTVLSLLEQRNLTDRCDKRLNAGRGARVRGQAFF